jgi:Ca2+-binding EF-hand superfamily protein
MDANHDGKVTAAEMDASLAHVKGRRPSRSMKALNATAADKIKLSDRDHDGVLTLEEHLIAAMGIFEKMDTDKNGFLTSAELAAGHTVALPKVHRR